MCPDPSPDQVHPRGIYAETGRRELETDAQYEWERFEKSEKGRRLNQRERSLVNKFLQGLPPGQIVLDVPAGMGRFTDLIVRQGHTPISMDLNFPRIRAAQSRLAAGAAAVQADILELPLIDHAVGAALCFRLLHHLSPDLAFQVLQELRRVSACAFVTFYCRDTFKYYKKRLRGKSLRGRYYPASFLQDLSQKAGWRSCRHQPAFGFFRTLHALRLST